MTKAAKKATAEKPSPGLYKLAASEVEAVCFRRKGARRLFRESGTHAAAEVIGPIAPGEDICGVTNGQFSLVDVVEHVLSQTGPADVAIATWTMGIYDAEQAYRFVADKRIRSIRFVVDPSMSTRRPDLAAVLVKAFGPDAFRAVNSHAKFATVRGDTLAVAIRSSMNLNRNERLESFDITACPEMTGFFETLVSKIWVKVDQDSRSQSRAIFEHLLEVTPVKRPRRRNPFLSAAITSSGEGKSHK
jgi:hypothetical protein